MMSRSAPTGGPLAACLAESLTGIRLLQTMAGRGEGGSDRGTENHQRGLVAGSGSGSGDWMTGRAGELGVCWAAHGAYRPSTWGSWGIEGTSGTGRTGVLVWFWNAKGSMAHGIIKWLPSQWPVAFTGIIFVMLSLPGGVA